jgi:hypothetical protein
VVEHDRKTYLKCLSGDRVTKKTKNLKLGIEDLKRQKGTTKVWERQKLLSLLGLG